MVPMRSQIISVTEAIAIRRQANQTKENPVLDTNINVVIISAIDTKDTKSMVVTAASNRSRKKPPI